MTMGWKALLHSGPMELLINIFLGLHVIGIAGLLGGFLMQVRAAGDGAVRFVPGMFHGALVMLITGIALAGLNRADGNDLSAAKLAVKLAVLVVITALIYVKRDEEQVDKGIFRLVGLLTVANIFIAVLWT